MINRPQRWLTEVQRELGLTDDEANSVDRLVTLLYAARVWPGGQVDSWADAIGFTAGEFVKSLRRGDK